MDAEITCVTDNGAGRRECSLNCRACRRPPTIPIASTGSGWCEQLKSVAAACRCGRPPRSNGRSSAAQATNGPPGLPRPSWPADLAVPDQRYVGWSRSSPRNCLPPSALAGGRVSEWRAMIVARETAWLAREHRRAGRCRCRPSSRALGDRKVEAEVKALGYRLDPHGYVGRIRGAESDRRVGPAARTGYDVPAQCSAAGRPGRGRVRGADPRGGPSARLRRPARTRPTDGRHPGRAHHRTGRADDVPVEVNLVMTDTALLDGDSAEPAVLPVTARSLPTWRATWSDGPGEQVPRWLRRLYPAPTPAIWSPWTPAGDCSRLPNGTSSTARPELSHPVVRRPDPACRPRRAGRITLTAVEIRTPTGHRYRHSPPPLPQPPPAAPDPARGSSCISPAGSPSWSRRPERLRRGRELWPGVAVR